MADFYATNQNLVLSGGGGGGTVSQVDTGTGLTGGPITTTGTVSLANTAVTPGSYTLASITVDAQGRLTAASSGTVTGFANLTLSNLTAPTAINVSLLPNADGVRILGQVTGTARRWDSSYIRGLRYTSTQTVVSAEDLQLLDLAGSPRIDWGNPNILIDNLAWPTSDGSAGQVLTTNGAGVLSFTTNGSGTVTSVVAGTGLNVGAGPGGTITTTGTLNLANTAVTPGSYTNADITVDAQGRITAASSGTTGADWSLAGNALTGAEVLGSTNNFPLNFIIAGSTAATITTNNALQFGFASAGGSISATGAGGEAHGQAGTSSTITAGAAGAAAFGFADNSASIASPGRACLAMGAADASQISAAGEACFVGGDAQAGGLIESVTTSSFGCISFGGANSSGILRSNGVGCVALGLANNSGLLDSAGSGNLVVGLADGSSSQIRSTGSGAVSLGVAQSEGQMQSGSAGSVATGYANGTGSLIRSASDGTFVSGRAVNGGTIEATESASRIGGYCDGGTISAAGSFGSFVYGAAVSGGALTAESGIVLGGANGTDSVVRATANGANAAIGLALSGGIVESTGLGSIAMGLAESTNVLSSSGNGSIVQGYATAFGITASGWGSHAGGMAETGAIAATNNGTFAHGDDVEASGQYAQAFGIGHDNSSDYAMVFGQYADVSGSAGSPAGADTLLGAGNGSIGTPANAFEVCRDGKMTTTGAQVHKAINVYNDAASPVTVSARTNRTLIADNAAGAVTFNLPAGEEGLEFLISATSSALANNVVLSANGADTFQTGGGTFTFATGVNAIGAHIQFTGGVWYFLSYYQV